MSIHEIAWAGVDIGKAHHWVVVIDHYGRRRLSRKVANEEPALVELIAAAHGIAPMVVWAVDVVDSIAWLLLALLEHEGQQVRYVSGTAARSMAAAFPGEGKTDARDAYVIAETVRPRRDLPPARLKTEPIARLRALLARREMWSTLRVRAITQLRITLMGICPALERTFRSPATITPIVLLTGFQTPTAINQVGVDGLETWLIDHGARARHARAVAQRAVAAAGSQRVQMPGESAAAETVALLAHQILDVRRAMAGVLKEITETFRQDHRAAVIESMPGFGPLLGAELLAVVGDMSTYNSPAHLAVHAGLVPVARSSGAKIGHRKPRRYHRRLRRTFYLAALAATYRPGLSQDFYRRKREEGKAHVPAVIALARRRVDVLWALLRDGRLYTQSAPETGASLRGQAPPTHTATEAAQEATSNR